MERPHSTRQPTPRKLPRQNQTGNKPFLRIYFDVKLNGKTVVRRRLSRSWVKAFLYMIYAHFSATSVSIANTAGSTQTVNRNTNDWFCNAGADVSNNGINVGTGTDAVTTSDAKLQTPIATGNSSGQLRYLASTVNNLQTDSTTNSFQLIRSFVNNSGASITVNEFGIYGDNTGGTNFYCLARDVLGTGVAIGNGQTLTITYTISVGL